MLKNTTGGQRFEVKNEGPVMAAINNEEATMDAIIRHCPSFQPHLFGSKVMPLPVPP